MGRTTYSEVTAADQDVAAFIASHPNDVNLYHLPVKMWVAREGERIVAVLMLNIEPYVALDLTVADPKTRPFMRIFKLVRMAETWLRERGVPIVCAAIHDSNPHYQSLVRRFGYQKVGVETNIYGEPVETIFAKHLTPTKGEA